MTFALGVTLTVMFVIISRIIWCTFFYKKKITEMTGMMIAMVLGMGTGLTIGTIVGFLLPGLLFHSTVIGMIIGMIPGFLAGITTGLKSVLDGIFAGLMGGMMGAMLGEMIGTDYQEALIRIMFLLYVGTMMIVLHMMEEDFIKSNTLFSRPYILLVTYIFLIIFYPRLGPILAF